MLEKIKKILAAEENEKTFLARIEKVYSPFSREFNMVRDAYIFARTAFSGILRESGEPFFTHARAVAIILIDYLYIFERMDLRMGAHEVVVGALLHDVIEDCPDRMTLKIVRKIYGSDVAWILDYISKKPKSDIYTGEKEILESYYRRFHVAPQEFFLIKLADRLHNQLTIFTCSEEKIRRKNWETIHIYLPWARKTGILAHELEATVMKVEDRIVWQKSKRVA